MPKYLPAERTARKARKLARQEAAAEFQQEQETKRLALIARMEDLVTEQEALAAESASRKNCAKRKAVRRANSPKKQAVDADTVDFTVVHGSASCEEEDEDVLALRDFLEPGINPKIDEAFEAQQAAQDPLVQMQQQELALKAQEIEIKKQKLAMDAAAEADRIEIEKARIEAQERIAGLQAGVKAASEKARLDAETEIKGVEIGSRIAKDRMDMLRPQPKPTKQKG